MTRYLAIYKGNYIVKYCQTLREAHDFLLAKGWMDNDEVTVVPVRAS
jgi:hypothetical protein